MKKILYVSGSKFPLAGLAGAIHSGSLPAGKEPAVSALWSLPFMKLNKNNEGEIISLGEDEQGNKIFALSIKGDRALINRLIDSFISIYQRAPEELYMVDIKFRENYLLRAGQILCRSVILTPLGRTIVLAGVKKIFDSLNQLVHEQKQGKGKLP
ncbi:DUF3189 family protein [Pelotomaculum terephthalicicum JT]|uniref:DUF3189 family protein n=1 Tax=Pelotomaculum TaxID=191373 RepID=UPI0009CD432E|nr:MULTISPECIES: DUF3189 family protein [Pelotomaculum]MCG9967707.1 DUF3189 family protein [Pelotomaculum terephthalicicum JT]OPX83999.1 MAG: hypothetical protein A4E54_02964 [Pelotomaculum sp. PtaB.Bin117]OPY62938.1 MAG: hypothetical protein A4E56_01005 [Pelotomaculum sp. PtaU1.Bin065]